LHIWAWNILTAEPDDIKELKWTVAEMLCWEAEINPNQVSDAAQQWIEEDKENIIREDEAKEEKCMSAISIINHQKVSIL
jgi:hypothetical protein